MTIRILPDTLVSRIAAGEVIERPAAVVKELVENALDAGARSIEIVLREGGKSFIAVSDDGCGMDAEDLALAVRRHATSKLVDDMLVRIATLGFRGEALPSIGAAARLTILSRPRGGGTAHTLSVEGGRLSPPRPAALREGTRVEVRDLFFATPARLKFLKADRTEWSHCLDVVLRLAMAHPEVAFRLSHDGQDRIVLDQATGEGRERLRRRLADCLGAGFVEDALDIEARRDDLVLSGLAALPAASRRTTDRQFLFVNGRPVRDRMLAGALRGAYQEVLARDRHPAVALFLEVPPDFVDVNVHPAKTEVRFRDPGQMRGLLVGAIRHALAGAGVRPSRHVSEAALGAFRGGAAMARPGDLSGRPSGSLSGSLSRSFSGSLSEPLSQALAFQAPLPQPIASDPARPEAPEGQAFPPAATADGAENPRGLPLGLARTQLFNTYIIAESDEGMVIVDQHAAHERLVTERIREALGGRGVARQILLIPEVIDLEPGTAEPLLARSGELAALGLVIEAFGPGAVVVRETPALLGTLNLPPLLRDLAEEIGSLPPGMALIERLDTVTASMACHSSVRAGRRLNPDEMNALLRSMEATPNAAQCGHGRPTFIVLGRGDIERLFGRR